MIQRTPSTTNDRDSAQPAALRALSRILRPLVRILLRAGIPYGAFAEELKRAYVEVSESDFKVDGRKITTSRISILTGLTRRDVSRLRKAEEESMSSEGSAQKYHRAARVVSAWARDRDRYDPAGIPLNGEVGSFAALVRESAGDVPVRAVLDELERVETVSRGEDDTVRLLKTAYVPDAGDAAVLDLLGSDTAHLIRTIDHNMNRNGDTPLLQRKVSYDNVPDQALPVLRARVTDLVIPVIQSLDQLIASTDRDSGAGNGSGRNTAGVGIYYFEKAESEDALGENESPDE